MARHAGDVWAASEAVFAEGAKSGGRDAVLKKTLSSFSPIFLSTMR